MPRASVKFGTKGETLLLLSPLVRAAAIPPLTLVRRDRWKASASGTLKKLKSQFKKIKLVVRSSALSEDGFNASHAGEFLSVPHVNPAAEGELERAIDAVFASYKSEQPADQVIVQEMVFPVQGSGVMFTRDQETSAPYQTICFDPSTDSTSGVTAGNAARLSTFIRFRNSPAKPGSQLLASLENLARELEQILGVDYLDIEFAFDANNKLYLLQVRPIVLRRERSETGDAKFSGYLVKVQKKIDKLTGAHPGLYGDKAIFSVMTDWNPAEMIGLRPRPLALTLYREMIMDEVWAHQRAKYGYRDLGSFPLMVSFLGLPYIDVRASFNSFLPADLDPAIGAKLIDYYSTKLSEHPSNHDKVEFDVVFSCYYLSLPQRIKALLQHRFSELELDRIKFSLLRLTNRIIDSSSGLCRGDMDALRELERRYNEVCGSKLSLNDKIYWLIKDAKRFGTLPFAGLARAGFIAVQFLRSFVEIGLITDGEMQRYLSSLQTVGKQLANDTRKLQRKEMTTAEFLARYGHLRPGTYDILSPRYDEAFESYFKTEGDGEPEAAGDFRFSGEVMERLNAHLRENGISATAEQLITFITMAIEGREYAKFMFTRNVSTVLQFIEKFGSRVGLSKEDMSFADVKTIMDFYTTLSADDVRDILLPSIEAGRRSHELSQSVKLPPCICSSADVYDFTLGDVAPNFVTTKRILCDVVTENSIRSADIKNKILLVRAADPGYDWVFSHGIKGLITMYGGSNSHMTIRCSELEIPAVIGCGELNFALWSKAERIELDCENKQVRVISWREGKECSP